MGKAKLERLARNYLLNVHPISSEASPQTNEMYFGCGYTEQMICGSGSQPSCEPAMPTPFIGPQSGSWSRRAGGNRSRTGVYRRSGAEILRQQVALEVEGLDRVYLNVPIPQLQRQGG